MEFQAVLDAVRALPTDDRVRLVDFIHDELDIQDEDHGLSEEQIHELKRRSAAHDADPSSSISGDEFFAYIDKRAKELDEPVYHRLIVSAQPKTLIWLVDDRWHPVESATGLMNTSVLRGRYYIELGATGRKGVAYPIELHSDLRVTQAELENGPACERQLPIFDDE